MSDRYVDGTIAVLALAIQSTNHAYFATNIISPKVGNSGSLSAAFKLTAES